MALSDRKTVLSVFVGLCSLLVAYWSVFSGHAAITANSSGNATRLEELLSKDAKILYPGDAGFVDATTRWSAAVRPGFDLVVRVESDKDVQHTIDYANTIGKPFLAISGGHGTYLGLNKLQNGIGIWMRGMNTVEIVNESIARIGGGALTSEVVGNLWDAGKQTGFMAPLLGGGHGYLQGRYGLMSDNLISARLVIANGSIVTVSAEEHPNLFWALQGAGHNFGIVTSVDYKIYDREPDQDQWSAMSFVFSHEKIEEVFAVGNQWLAEEDRDVRFVHYGAVTWITDVNPDNPIFMFFIFYQAAEIPARYTDPINALKPLSTTSQITTFAGVNAFLGADSAGIACAKGMSHLQFPVSLDSWPLTNLRTVVDIFSTMPEAYRHTVLLLEGYSTNAVTSILSDASAYPDRAAKLLISPLLTWPANASLDAGAQELGQKIRRALYHGTGKKEVSYVNYAVGSETVGDVYGHEQWRVERLRGLKKAWDPKGRFSWMAPIR